MQRDFDRLGRLSSIQYGDPTSTPDVTFGYDAAGNRTRMTEYGGAGFTAAVRETRYGYDAVRRLTSVGFDHDADSSVDETVSYEYDAGGLRTKLTLPGGTDSITYVYNAKGELVSLMDWDDQETRLAYDRAGRHIATIRANGLRSRYSYDAAGRLRLLRHTAGQRTLGHFAYEVDGRGNRTQATEFLLHPPTEDDITLAYDDASITYKGTWSDDDPFMVSDAFSAGLSVLIAGREVSFTYGVGPDHSIFDVYIGRTLWQSYDGYAASTGEVTQIVELNGDGPYLFEFRNRPEKNPASSGYKIRFKQIVLPDIAYDLRTIQYTYDALSRLTEANYNNGATIYTYGYDLAGNLTNNNGATRTYNAANQMTHDGTNSLTYDANGNLTSDGTNTYVWDRANRLLSMGGVSYQYNGV